ncbi:hypothetical protein D5F01_LYC01223 [Larimichthys crocea]|uniref:Uncharacterized protein n=1 Tax=Larimichthys crocea TaxID=215358 RepID=A0A6G0JBH5_LARCR|nr:hypothetical protein D5F01_LYC01223 [Larimichthys crocea]
MTKPKNDGVCPICGKTLQLVVKHLRETHAVRNSIERSLLNNLATGRTIIPPCPVPGCLPHILNVDKHLAVHKDLTVAEIKRWRAQTTRETAIAALARLPQPQACRSCRDLKKQIKELKAQVAALEGRLRRNKVSHILRGVLSCHSRVTNGQTKMVIRELRKLHKDLGRTVLWHQGLIKQKKGLKLVPREDLARCQAMARVKMPSLLEAIEKAPPRDPRRRYRFFGYLAAYLSSIYGHRTGVLTRMRVMEHKTVRKFGPAQLYLEAEEYRWFRTWLRLRNRTVPTNPYFFSSLGREGHHPILSMAWVEMGLKGTPSLVDIRTAVSTYCTLTSRKARSL